MIAILIVGYLVIGYFVARDFFLDGRESITIEGSDVIAVIFLVLSWPLLAVIFYGSQLRLPKLHWTFKKQKEEK